MDYYFFIKLRHKGAHAEAQAGHGYRRVPRGEQGGGGVVLAYENQGVFDIGDQQVADGLVIADTKFSETQGGQSFLLNMFNM